MGLNYMSCKYSMSRRKVFTYETLKPHEGKSAREIATVFSVSVSTVYTAATEFGVVLKPGKNKAPTFEQLKQYEGLTYAEIAAAIGRRVDFTAKQIRRHGLKVKRVRSKPQATPCIKTVKPEPKPRTVQAEPPPKPTIQPAYETVGLPLSQLPPIKVLPPVPANEDPKQRLERLEAARARFKKSRSSQAKGGK